MSNLLTLRLAAYCKLYRRTNECYQIMHGTSKTCTACTNTVGQRAILESGELRNKKNTSLFSLLVLRQEVRSVMKSVVINEVLKHAGRSSDCAWLRLVITKLVL